MRAFTSISLQVDAPATAATPTAASVTNWPALLAILAFVIVSSVVMGWIGWKNRH